MEGDDGEALKRRTTGHKLESSRKRRRLDSSADEVVEIIVDEGDATVSKEVMSEDIVFKPLYIV